MTAEKGRKTLVFLLSILILIGYPIFFIFTVPLLIFRFIVAKLAPYLRPKLRKMVTARGSVFAAEDYTNVPTTTVTSAIVLEGQVDLETVIEMAGKRLLEARLPNGDVRYPELKQYVTTWMGYYFWKEDKKFDVKNHIKIHQGHEKFTDHDFQAFIQNTLKKTWAKKRSMWDITFVPNFYPAGLKSPGPHTVLIVRLHHVLADGYSTVSFLVEELCQSEIKLPLPNYLEKSFCGNILDQITFPFRSAYYAADIFSIRFEKNVPFGITEKMSIGKYNMAVSDIISLKTIKDIKEHFNVCFSSVVSAALAGAIRDLLISKHMKFPTVLHISAPQPLSGHSLKLRNHYTFVTLKYPIGEDDPVKRLKYCDANYKKIRNSVQPRFFDYSFMLIGSYFAWLIKYIMQNYSENAEITNLPGPSTDSVHFNGHKWLDYWFTAAFQPEACGLIFCASSFVDGLRISPIEARGFLSQEEVNELSFLIFKHMNILHEQIISDV